MLVNCRIRRGWFLHEPRSWRKLPGPRSVETRRWLRHGVFVQPGHVTRRQPCLPHLLFPWLGQLVPGDDYFVSSGLLILLSYLLFGLSEGTRISSRRLAQMGLQRRLGAGDPPVWFAKVPRLLHHEVERVRRDVPRSGRVWRRPFWSLPGHWRPTTRKGALYWWRCYRFNILQRPRVSNYCF